MQTYELAVRNRSIRLNSADKTLVRTSVGVDQVHIMFDDAEWVAFPVTVTFAQGDVVVTQAVTLSAIVGSDWVAQATCEVPSEVTQRVGQIRITVQGTDSDGNHIITAKGAPLTVEEAGDVDAGEAPEGSPTIDQWQQAYAQAVAAANAAKSLVENLEAQIGTMVSEAEGRLNDAIDEMGTRYPPATNESLGVVQIGSGISVTDGGVISADGVGLTDEQQRLLGVVSDAFDGEVVRSTSLPIARFGAPGAVYPDGVTVTVASDGLLVANPVSVTKLATEEEAGISRPDGTTIVVHDGVLSVGTAIEYFTDEQIDALTPFGNIIPSVDREAV